MQMPMECHHSNLSPWVGVEPTQGCIIGPNESFSCKLPGTCWPGSLLLCHPCHCELYAAICRIAGRGFLKGSFQSGRSSVGKIIFASTKTGCGILSSCKGLPLWLWLFQHSSVPVILVYHCACSHEYYILKLKFKNIWHDQTHICDENGRDAMHKFKRIKSKDLKYWVWERMQLKRIFNSLVGRGNHRKIPLKINNNQTVCEKKPKKRNYKLVN